MAVFKDAGAVVTTPSSGTYVIECIGNVGALADLLADRVRELGGDEARDADEAFRGGVPSDAATSSRPSRGKRKAVAATRGSPKPKREPSKTKAAIAAAKRRARIKAEKLAAEGEARQASRELPSLRASRETKYAYDASLDVEEDVAEAAEAMRGMIPAASPSGLGLPPDFDAVSESDEEGREDLREGGTTKNQPETPSAFPEGTANETDRERDRSAASLFAARLRERFPRDAAFAFDRKEAAVCEMRGWDRVAACRVRSVDVDGGVIVACRTAETDGAFVGAFRVPPRAALRVLAHRAPETLGERGEEKRLPEPPPTFPSGSAERRRALASAAAAAAALAAARREGPDAFAPGSWVLERRAAAEAAASGGGRKRLRFADATEAPPERGAGLASALERDIALLAHEVASFRRETREGLASACAGLERVAAEIRALGNGGGAKPPDGDAGRGGGDAQHADAGAREEKGEGTAKMADEAGPSKSPFERSAFVAEARALAALCEQRADEAKKSPSEPPRGGATTASEAADKKSRGEASPAPTRLPGPRDKSASPDRSLEVVPETPADGAAGGADSGAGGERFHTPRGRAGGEDQSARAATSGDAGLERDVPGAAFAG
jgi:hypothetical protein